MAKLCNACGGAVCPDCGGCINHGECSCVGDDVKKLLQPLREQVWTVAQKLEEVVPLFSPLYRFDREDEENERIEYIEGLVREAMAGVQEIEQAIRKSVA